MIGGDFAKFCGLLRIYELYELSVHIPKANMKQVWLGKLDEYNLPAGPNRHFITVVHTCKQSETSQEMNRTLLKIKVSTWGDKKLRRQIDLA